MMCGGGAGGQWAGELGPFVWEVLALRAGKPTPTTPTLPICLLGHDKH